MREMVVGEDAEEVRACRMCSLVTFIHDTGLVCMPRDKQIMRGHVGERHCRRSDSGTLGPS